MPTLIRKNGMKMAFPTNSMRFISDDVEGISLLSDRPDDAFDTGQFGEHRAEEDES